MARLHLNTETSSGSGSGSGSPAVVNTFDDTVSQLGAATVQEAIEENDERLDELRDQDYVRDFLTGLQ